MKVIPFKKKESAFTEPPPIMGVCEISVFLRKNSRRTNIICFLDRAQLCSEYFASNPWLTEEVLTVSLTADAQKFYKIQKVPTFVFFDRYREIHRIIGLASREILLDRKEKFKEGELL